MCFALKKLIKDIRDSKIDCVLFEYPFVEWNPFIIFYYRKLSLLCKKKNIKLFLSIDFA